MPIYAYKCSSCGHSEDVMQKFSDAPLTICTACGRKSFSKQLTAAGFQLKGSGWYVTDFKNNGSSKKEQKKDSETSSPSEKAPATCGAGACPACT
ncbi:MAG: FmdB family zinc ribbon protein [Sutterellaceae bacterium]|nr:zinc ribbon domain-containing protein [Burkholderiaceae bacterium]MCX7901135.1 zinc ribbon domain-containing protein [Burkholderiaceae bacterium]MDW8430065.1 FmdB family zinc ribbon protein [Sutterellaceae bacterium]